MKKVNILILFLFLSCSDSSRRPIRIKKGLCVQEINKLYISSSLGRGNLYKITSIDGDKMKLKRWYNNGWYHLGEKGDQYFKETLRFRFTKISCPGDENKSEIGIDQKLKKISI